MPGELIVSIRAETAGFFGEVRYEDEQGAMVAVPVDSIPGFSRSARQELPPYFGAIDGNSSGPRVGSAISSGGVK